jgi:hypothetical protein
LSYIVQIDSVLASTAAELRERHRPDGAGGACPSCGWPAPCPAARHADVVLAATPAPVAAARDVPTARTDAALATNTA